MILTLFEEPKWIDVMFFVLDELNTPSKLNQFLMELVHAGGTWRRKLVAYAWKIRGRISGWRSLRAIWSLLRRQDLQETPAAI